MQFLSILIIKYIKDVIFIKKLPKIYQNDINKTINNNKKMCYVDKNNRKNISLNQMTNTEINDFIDHIFNTTGYAFNTNVMIKTKDNLYHTSIIAKMNNYILTMNEEKIKIEDIISITKEDE